MLIKPFANLGEYPTPSEEDTYLGTVINNTDPLKLGRVRVLIDLYDDLEEDSIPWATPLLETFLGNSVNSIKFSVPELGSQVRVSFPNKDKYAPFYSGCEINLENKCTFFDDDYPNCYGTKDSVGNFIKVNKATKYVTIQHSSTTNLQIAPDGTAMVTNPNGTSITFDSVGNITLDNAKIVQAQCNDFNVYSGTALFDNKTTTFSGSVQINGDFNLLAGVSANVPLPNGMVLVFTNGILTSVI